MGIMSVEKFQHLFWLGRYTERVFSTLRIFCKYYDKMIDNDTYQLILLNSSYEIASNELNAQVEVVDKLVKTYDKKAIVAGEGPLMKDLTMIR